jgi:hypothetical protein
MSAQPARRLHRPVFTPARERHLRVIPGGLSDHDSGPADAFCCGCSWSPPGRPADLADAVAAHIAGTGHAVIYREPAR